MPLLDSPLYSLYITLCLVGAVILFLIIKKIFFYLIYRKRVYIFPKIGIKGITNVAMTISIAIVLLVFLTIVSSGLLGVLFRAYPGWRATTEGILIKIGGLLFGPIIGMFIGAFTDLLSVALTAGMFHYGFLLSSVLMGLLSGLVKTLIFSSKNSQFYFAIGSSILIVLLGVASNLYVYYANNSDVYSLHFFNGLKIEKWKFCCYLSTVYGIGLIIIWINIVIFYRFQLVYLFGKIGYCLTYKMRINKFKNALLTNDDLQETTNKHLVWYTKFGSSFNTTLNSLHIKEQNAKQEQKHKVITYFLPVFVTILFTETLVNIFILPQIDNTIQKMGYETWLATRMVISMFSIPFNILVIYPVYRIVLPVMRYDYRQDSIESVLVAKFVE